jgi:hypothetical protein
MSTPKPTTTTDTVAIIPLVTIQHGHGRDLDGKIVETTFEAGFIIDAPRALAESFLREGLAIREDDPDARHLRFARDEDLPTAPYRTPADEIRGTIAKQRETLETIDDAKPRRRNA